jgi:EAL domain-containing protein (putative c-di-GMP-specific phosphodiesterase class I)
VAVNVSPIQFRSQTLALNVAAALAASGLSAGRLELEITEAVLIRDDEVALEVLHQLRKLGVRIALDDFGTGYSSLAYLRELPFDELKLDRVFGSDLGRPATATIVRHCAAMAHELGLRVVAEGVEDATAAARLADLGCDVGQGLAFGAAVPPATFAALLAARDSGIQRSEGGGRTAAD